jgi:hypothetical protein
MHASMETSSRLCLLCQGITINSLVRYRGRYGSHVNSSGYEHQPCYNDLIRSAERCDLCHLILFALEYGDYGLKSAKDAVPKYPRNHWSTSILLQSKIGAFNNPDDNYDIHGTIRDQGVIFSAVQTPKRLSYVRILVGHSTYSYLDARLNLGTFTG